MICTIFINKETCSPACDFLFQWKNCQQTIIFSKYMYLIYSGPASTMLTHGKYDVQVWLLPSIKIKFKHPGSWRWMRIPWKMFKFYMFSTFFMHINVHVYFKKVRKGFFFLLHLKSNSHCRSYQGKMYIYIYPTCKLNGDNWKEGGISQLS